MIMYFNGSHSERLLELISELETLNLRKEFSLLATKFLPMTEEQHNEVVGPSCVHWGKTSPCPVLRHSLSPGQDDEILLIKQRNT